MEKSSQKMVTCRKDMQCICPMCLASFQATSDLRRPFGLNNAFQNITNLEESFKDGYRTPTPPPFRAGKENNTPGTASNDETICMPGTPFLQQKPTHLVLEPMGQGSSLGKKNDGSTLKGQMRLRTFALVVGLLLVIIIVLPDVASRIYPPALSRERVANLVKESTVRIRTVDRLDLIQRRLLQSLPGQDVSNCSGPAAAWSLNEARYLVHSECKMYSSPAESVTVWGSPVKTAGVIGRATRERSFTVVSGRVFEWREGRTEYQIHEKGGTWILPHWAASAIYLEGSTWLVEYKEGIFSGLKSFSGVMQLLGHQIRKLLFNLQDVLDIASLAYSTVTRGPDLDRLPT